MRVAHLTTVDLSLRYLVMPQLTAIVDAGGEVIGISAAGPHVPELEAAGIRHVSLPGSTRGFNPMADVKAAWSLWRILRQLRPDVLHTHNPKPGVYGRIVGRMAGVPVVLNTVHGLYATPDDRWPKRLVVYLLEAIASRFSDVELVQSREDLDFLRKWHITPRSRTRLLGNGVDLARFDPDRLGPAMRAEVRAELGIDSEQIVVGMVGRLVAEKGYPELFAAARTLGSGYTVVVVGPHDPDKPDSLPAEMVTAAGDHGVRFLGMRTDVDRLYTAMDIFALPSYREGFPRAAMEAAAMHLPIVATDIRGCREVVIPGENGLLIPRGDATALADALQLLGADADLRHTMGNAGRARAERHFDEDAVVQRVVKAQFTAMRSKQITLPVASAEPALRDACGEDAAAIAAMHRAGIATGFLPRLGIRFLKRLYEAMIGWEDGVVVVADDGFGPVGFVAGVADVAGFYSHFARRHGPAALLSALPSLLRPGNLRRAWETWSYSDTQIDVEAELLSMAVEPSARGRGLGTRLGEEFLTQRRWPEVKVVVAVGNEAARATYRRLGFVTRASFEVHRGESSVAMVRTAPPATT